MHPSGGLIKKNTQRRTFKQFDTDKKARREDENVWSLREFILVACFLGEERHKVSY